MATRLFLDLGDDYIQSFEPVNHKMKSLPVLFAGDTLNSMKNKKVQTKIRGREAPKPVSSTISIEIVPIASLKPHPKNYRHHGAEQLKHLVKSIKTEGVYRNIVVARDGTILAGHGVVEACKKVGLTDIEVKRLNVSPDDPRAMKVLTGDNEIARLGEIDDRILTDILKSIAAEDAEALLGTGFDQMQLANLVFVTRPESEIKDFNAALEWVGLPAYEEKDEEFGKLPLLVISFDNEDDRKKFVDDHNIKIGSTRGGRRWSTTWPFKERNDRKSVKFEATATQ